MAHSGGGEEFLKPEHIVVVDNGNSSQPLDETEKEIKKLSPLVTYASRRKCWATQHRNFLGCFLKEKMSMFSPHFFVAL